MCDNKEPAVLTGDLCEEQIRASDLVALTTTVVL